MMADSVILFLLRLSADRKIIQYSQGLRKVPVECIKTENAVHWADFPGNITDAGNLLFQERNVFLPEGIFQHITL